MANNYCPFSERFALELNPERVAWLTAAFADDPAQLTEEERLAWSRRYGMTAADCADFWMSGVVTRFEEDALIAYDEEGGPGMEHLAAVLSTYLREFQLNKQLTIQYADYCDKPRTGNFGGGLLFITAKGVWGINTGTLAAWLEQEQHPQGRCLRKLIGAEEQLSMKEAAQKTMLSVGSTNLSGLAQDFPAIVDAVRQESLRTKEGTDWVNTHPICQLYLEQMAAVAGLSWRGNGGTMEVQGLAQEPLSDGETAEQLAARGVLLGKQNEDGTRDAQQIYNPDGSPASLAGPKP